MEPDWPTHRANRGDRCDRGERGAASGVSGYEIVSDTTTNTTSSGGVNGFFSVTCPQGKKAVGGGGSAVDGIGAIGVNDGVRASLPTNGGASWLIAVWVDNPSNVIRIHRHRLRHLRERELNPASTAQQTTKRQAGGSVTSRPPPLPSPLPPKPTQRRSPSDAGQRFRVLRMAA